MEGKVGQERHIKQTTKVILQKIKPNIHILKISRTQKSKTTILQRRKDNMHEGQN